tara:strand:+ start:123 stop:467 length:345 start_codon:yes stop_codon:yes gene_type:complete
MKKNKRICLALDLINDPNLISEYIEYHKNVWPEIKESLLDSGIEKAEIYHTDDRLFMILDVNDSFSLSKKKKMDNSNPIVNEWENLMWKYQKSLPSAKKGEKWVLMRKVFDLSK